MCLATGKFCSNYKAEVEALSTAADVVCVSKTDCRQVVLFIDALSVLEALSGDKLNKLKGKFHQVCQKRRVTLRWVPSQCGILGNELADPLAKRGAAEHQTENQVTHHEQKTLIKATMKQRPERDDYHLLGRAEQVIVFRLRTGHCRLKQHTYQKLKIAPTRLHCRCSQVEQKVSHILQDCPLLDQLRRSHGLRGRRFGRSCGDAWGSCRGCYTLSRPRGCKCEGDRKEEEDAYVHIEKCFWYAGTFACVCVVCLFGLTDEKYGHGCNC